MYKIDIIVILVYGGVMTNGDGGDEHPYDNIVYGRL